MSDKPIDGNEGGKRSGQTNEIKRIPEARKVHPISLRETSNEAVSSPQPDRLIKLLCKVHAGNTNTPSLVIRFSLLPALPNIDSLALSKGFEYICTSFVITAEFEGGVILKQSHDLDGYEKPDRHTNDYEISLKPEVSFNGDGLPNFSFGEVNWKSTSQTGSENGGFGTTPKKVYSSS